VARLRPFPNGWYCVGFSNEFPTGEVRTRRLAGREVVLFRTECGTLHAIDPVCPHMGAHLGHGGTVEGETIRCPFHAFRFDGGGACVATGYGTKPPKARARTYPSCERHGAALVWFDPQGREPLWQIPELELAGWTDIRTHTFRLRGHPHDTTENSVDIGHLSVVHGYEAVEQLSELVIEGPYLNARYAMTRPVELLGQKATKFKAEFDIHVHGLGYSFVEVLVKSAGIQTRNFVYATPVGEMKLELRIAMSLRRIADTPSAHPFLRALPERLAERFVLEQAFRAYKHDVEQDFEIWNHKSFVEQPALALGDGPIARYRKWATQFFEEAPAASPM
jgi:cholesterol 7-desaturase